MESVRTLVARERPINTFTRRQIRDTRIEIFWKRYFLLGPPRGYIARAIGKASRNKFLHDKGDECKSSA
jgi:hypothetical protein